MNLNRSNEKMKMLKTMDEYVEGDGDFDTPACLQHCHNKIDAPVNP
jgi:hypothetical protein